MKKALMAGVLAAAFTLPAPAAAQSAQDRLDTRYNRAMAAGYKALMLCSAMALAEANGTSRTPDSVHEWELQGIQAPLDDVVRELPYEIVRAQAGHIRHVLVKWADDMPPRIARHDSGYGCVNLPVGWDPVTLKPELDAPVAPPTPPAPEPQGKATDLLLFYAAAPKDTAQLAKKEKWPLQAVAERSLGGAYGTGTRTTAVLFRKGEVETGFKEYAHYKKGFNEDTPQRTWSVAKSIAATLVGAAIHRGDACSDARLPTPLTPGAGDPRNDVTLDHLLRMASGRYSDTPGNRTVPIYWGGATVDERAATWPLVYQPGTTFRYANNDTLMAVKTIECSFKANPPSAFFAKLGMNKTVAETDWQGNYILSSQVWMTADDLARLGELYLNDGVWNGERLLPENWIQYISDPSGPQPKGTKRGYGAGWWTFRRPEGNAYEGIPDDAFYAAGRRGQYLVIVPSRNVVIVRRGEDKGGTRFDIAAFTKDALAALD